MIRLPLALPRAAAVAVAATAILLTTAQSGQATTVPNTAASVQANIVPFVQQQLAEYGDSVDGPFKGGVWTDTDPAGGCWSCDNGGPATGAATLYVLTGHDDPALLQEAEQTINTAIADEQSPAGGFVPPQDPAGEAEETMFFGVEFGTTYHLLAPYLSAATRASWQRSLAATANYLIDSGDTTWYANGNINLGYTEFLWLVWQATGESQFKQAYNDSWSFTMDPPQSKFPGCGWVTVQAPTRADGVGGKGYFVEQGPGGTGYDIEYSMLQLDVASRLYLLSGDPRALRVANMLINMEMPRVNTSTWMLDTSRGTRHTSPDRYVGFQTSAFAVLGLEGGRSDLTRYILPELDQDETWYPEQYQADASGFRRAFGDDISVIALAAANADTQQSSVVGSALHGLSLLGAIARRTAIIHRSHDTSRMRPTPKVRVEG